MKKRRRPAVPKKIKKRASSVKRRPVRRPAPAPAQDISDSSRTPAQEPQIPYHYGDDRIVLMVRDPWWLYTYWEVTASRQQQVIDQMRERSEKIAARVLRVYDVYGVTIQNAHGHFDIEIGPSADNWYIDVGRPDSEWVVEIGFRAVSGRFYPIVRSNTVRTPRYGVSDVFDEEWMIPDDLFWRLMGRSLGVEARSSMELKRSLKDHWRGVVSSERSEKTSRPAER